uniref:Uncharacterized protein n=1 Tax=Arundo donax TaxID=35708 RepID=A0A0A9EHU9_ARUDO
MQKAAVPKITLGPVLTASCCWLGPCRMASQCRPSA